MRPSSLRPRPLPCFIAIGFVGKRDLSRVAADDVRATLAAELDRLAQAFPAPHFALTGISPLAEGADTLFAEELARRGWMHRVFLPEPADRFFNAEDFAVAESSRRLLAGPNIVEVRVASRQHDRVERFAETSIEVAHACDVLLACCTAADWLEVQATIAATSETGPPAKRRGGTAETLKYAVRTGRPVRAVVIDAPAGPGACRVETHGDLVSTQQQHQPASFFDPQQKPTPLGELDYRAELAGIMAAAERESARGKRAVTTGGAVVLGTHVLATATAAAALVFSWPSIAPALLKAALLAAGFGCAVLMYLRRRYTHEAWVVSRLVAEMCRSAQGLVGRQPDDEPFAGGLRHLRDFQLGAAFRAFTTALHLLHLRDVRRLACVRPDGPATEVAALERFRRRYADERLRDQLHHFQSKRRSAHVSGHGLEWGFFALSGFGLIGAVLGVVHFEPVYHAMWEKVAIKFVPLALPVAAAALVGWIGLRDLDRRNERYAEMIELLEAELPGFERTVSPSILCRRVLQLERALLQEVIEWHQRMRHQRAG